VIVNRTQALILGFFLMVWGSLVVILVATPEVYDQALRLAPGRQRSVEIAFLTALSAFIALLSVGVVRRWRWVFWLILVAFLFGVLRVPVAVLQLTGILPTSTPSWYVVFQGLIAWSSSPSRSPCWPATVAPASGGPTEPSPLLPLWGVPGAWSSGQHQAHVVCRRHPDLRWSCRTTRCQPLPPCSPCRAQPTRSLGESGDTACETLNPQVNGLSHGSTPRGRAA
jgi:hypothetical protein